MAHLPHTPHPQTDGPWPIEAYFELVDSAHREGLIKFYTLTEPLFFTASGSRRKHHAWVGGYAAHLLEMLWLARLQYPAACAVFGESFAKNVSLSDVILTIYFHDVDKMFKYSYPKLHLPKQTMQALRPFVTPLTLANASVPFSDGSLWLDGFLEQYVLPFFGLRIPAHVQEACTRLHLTDADAKHDKTYGPAEKPARRISDLTAFCHAIDAQSAWANDGDPQRFCGVIPPDYQKNYGEGYQKPGQP